MFKIGDCVVYGIHGVCRITERESRMIDRKQVQYFVLEPLTQTGSRFLVPAQNQAALAKLRPVLTAEALEELLRSEAVREDSWIPDENLRKQTYRELINSGDRAALLRMVCSLHRQRELRRVTGKKFHLCDENFLRDAEKVLSSEFSLVLGLAPGQVGEYVRSALEK